MKKLVTLAMLSFVVLLPTMAQKGKMNSALVNLQNGDVAKAKENIDEALQDQEVQILSKAWMTKGDIYKAIYETKIGYDQTPTALFEAKAAYYKAFEVEENPKKKGSVKDGLEALANYFYVEGVGHFSNSKWSPAYRNFVSTLEINEFLIENGITKEIDTNAYFVVALAGFNISQFDDAIKCGEKLLSLGDEREVIYNILSESYKQKGMKDKYIAVLTEGREKHPGSLDLLYKEINYYLESDRLDELEVKLKEALRLDPTNHTLYQALANLAEKQNDIETALKMYDKAIEMEPDFYEAYYNKAIVYFSQAMKIIEAMNEEKDDNKYKQMSVEREKLLKEKCLPLLERAYAIKSDDASVVKALREVYARLNMMDELSKLPKY
jgi:tetratricopeptide (TPR) repeat protein